MSTINIKYLNIQIIHYTLCKILKCKITKNYLLLKKYKKLPNVKHSYLY